MTADNLCRNSRVVHIGNFTMNYQVITGLFVRITAKTCVTRDVFQRAGNPVHGAGGTVIADDNILLQICYDLTEEILACRYVSINRQAR